MRVRLVAGVCACLIAAIQTSIWADIFRWDNGRLIPGTEGITPQPGVRLDFRDLRFADLAKRNLHGSSFRHANLTRADLSESSLSGSDLTLANLSQAVLVGANLEFSELRLVNLRGANLSGATVTGSNLARATMAGANLSGASFLGNDLTNVDLSGATITSATFFDSVGLTPAQLYSTASYRANNLAGLRLSRPTNLDLADQDLSGAQFVGDLNGVDFSGAYLVNAEFSTDAAWRNVNVAAADLRGASGVRETGHNTIQGMGQIEGLSLSADEVLVIRDYDGDSRRQLDPMPIIVQNRAVIEQGGRLRLAFDKDAWHSIISFAPGIPVALGGTLELDFREGINATPLRGRSIRIFDWSGVRPQGRFDVESPYLWDLAGLYTTGEVRLTGAGLAGDYNGNHVVDQIDLDLVLQNWGTESAVPPVRWVNDYPSGPIDQHELDRVLINWGRSERRTSGVPEPSSMALLSCGTVMLLCMCARRRLNRLSER